MPARRSSPKPPKPADPKGDLAALGFRVADSGPHTSKTLMLQELETLLEAVPADAPAKAYRAAIVEENVLGKRTLSTRKETASRLTALHGLDPSKPLFRVLRRLWAVDPAARPQLGLLNGLARDPLLMATTAKVMGMAQGEQPQRSEMVAAVQGFSHDRLGPKVLDAVARNTASSWTQRGYLKGKTRKLLQPLKPHQVACFIRSDNELEFIAQPQRDWCEVRTNTCTVFMEPGSLWEKGYAESINGRFRDVFFNKELLITVPRAQILADRWRWEYNFISPHSAPSAYAPGGSSTWSYTMTPHCHKHRTDEGCHDKFYTIINTHNPQTLLASCTGGYAKGGIMRRYQDLDYQKPSQHSVTTSYPTK